MTNTTTNNIAAAIEQAQQRESWRSAGTCARAAMLTAVLFTVCGLLTGASVAMRTDTADTFLEETTHPYIWVGSMVALGAVTVGATIVAVMSFILYRLDQSRPS